MKEFKFYHKRVRRIFATRREFAILKIRKAFPELGSKTATEIKLTEV